MRPIHRVIGPLQYIGPIPRPYTYDLYIWPIHILLAKLEGGNICLFFFVS